MADRRRTLAALGSVAAAPTLLPMVFAPARAASQDDQIQIVPVAFENEGAELAGSLYSPRTAPVGALVIVHGSGPERRMDWLARLFAKAGFAVISYDKRGVGESGGTYEQMNNVSPENLRLLASDAAAALALFHNYSSMARLKRGYWGVSQAGWIVPIAQANFEAADFMVLWSGPLCTVCEELESGIGNGGNQSDDASTRRGIEAMRAQGKDTDPRVSLRKVTTPGLWIYGGRDETQPTRLSVERLQGLIDDGQNNFVYWLNSSAHHADFEANRPFFEAMKRWMLERADLPAQPAPVPRRPLGASAN